MGLYRQNDNRHSQIIRIHQPRQAKLDSGRPTTARFGRTEVTGLSSASALTDFTMGGSVTGLVWSLNPYVGCLHACSYCYVPQTMHLERSRWGAYVAPKLNLASVLRRELQTREPRTVYLSTATDAYQAPEREHRITRACLQEILRVDWPVDILTRSPLVVRDLDLLRRLTHVRVGLTIPTLDDKARSLIEPHAPPIRPRLRALRALTDAGIATYANLAPAYPPTGPTTPAAVAAALRDAGIGWVNHSGWRRVPEFLAPLWDQFHGTPWRALVQFMAHREAQESWRRELYAALKPTGIPVREGFYNPPFEPQAYVRTSQMKLEGIDVEASSTLADKDLLSNREPSGHVATESPLLAVIRRS